MENSTGPRNTGRADGAPRLPSTSERHQGHYEPLLNDAQAAAFLGGLHPKTVQRMARRDEIPHYHVGKYYRYRASELDAWLRGEIHSPCQKHPFASTTRKEIIN